MAENDAPERFWIDKNDIESMTESEQVDPDYVEYVRANLAAPDAAQFPQTTYKNKRQLSDGERFKLNKALNEYTFNNCDHEHDGYPNHLVCRWCVLEILAAIQVFRSSG